jgi:signal peptidase I
VIEEQAPQKPPRSSSSSFWKELPILLGVAILVAVLVRAFLLQTFYIPSPSMEHTLDINDRVLVNKIVYNFRAPERGEIIVFRAPSEWRSGLDDEDFIKRVIAVGGDRVECCDEQKRLRVNGHSIDEPYLFNENGISDPAADQPFDFTVPKGRLWVMGDHRAASGDSLEHWKQSDGDPLISTITVDSVVGRAFVVFWPVGRAKWLSVPDTFDSVPAPASG